MGHLEAWQDHFRSFSMVYTEGHMSLYIHFSKTGSTVIPRKPCTLRGEGRHVSCQSRTKAQHRS
jgi:hypothetical protein